MDHEEEEMDCVSVLSGHVQDVKFVRFNPRNNNLYSCSYDDTIKVWLYDGEDYSNINTLRGHDGTVWGLAFKHTQGEEVSAQTMEEEPTRQIISGVGLDEDDGMDEIEVPDDTQIESEFISCGMNGKVIYWNEVQGISDMALLCRQHRKQLRNAQVFAERRRERRSLLLDRLERGGRAGCWRRQRDAFPDGGREGRLYRRAACSTG